MTKLPKNRPCLLCGKTSRRVRSHIIPQFATRALRKTSATGGIRRSDAPNKRIQAGPWDYLLCRACEDRFNKWETPFATNIFMAALEGRAPKTQPYDGSLSMLATSLTWRYLAYCRAQSRYPEHPKINDWLVTDEAEIAWRETLLEKRADPGVYAQHLLRFDYVEAAARPAPQNLNSYLMRSFDCDLMSNGEDIYVYVKLGPFMFVGFVRCQEPERWQGTKLDFGGGEIGDQNVPGFVFDDIIRPKAAHGLKALASMSDRQQQKIEANIMKDPERARRSGTYRAKRYDRNLRGH